MGHKVHPKVFRLFTVFTWDSKWFSRKNYQKFAREDILIRKFLRQLLAESGVDNIVIERGRREIVITVNAAKPGLIIGRGGLGAEELRKKIQQKFFKQNLDKGSRANIKLNIQEIAAPALASAVVIHSIVMELEKRVPFRKVMKQAIERVMKAGALGVRINVSGRLNGAEIARAEKLSAGKLPLHNLRADIDYAAEEAHTIFGTIGVKVWIYRRDVFKTKEQHEPAKEFKPEIKLMHAQT